MDASIRYRLILAKAFLGKASENLRRRDATSLAMAVVNVHDAVDNLLGAVASEKNIHLAEDLPMLRTYDKLGSEGLALGSRSRLAQLNALRNDVKHQGLHPNPTVVQSLVPEISEFCSETSRSIFGKILFDVHMVDAVEDESIRAEMERIELLIEQGDYRNALESMGFTMFRVYEEDGLGWKRFISNMLARMQGREPDEVEWEFPERDKDQRRLDFLELGIDPQEYDRFHMLVPDVGRRAGTEKGYVLRKSRHLWHDANWTRDNALQAFDFLLRVILAKQERSRPDSLIRKHPLDRVRVLCDSAIVDSDKETVIRALQEGSVLYAVALPYVDGAWQNHGEEFVCANYHDGEDWQYGCIGKKDIAVEPSVDETSDSAEEPSEP